MKAPKAFEELKNLSLEIHQYNSILGLLHWDQETYMPTGAITPRSQQIALLSSLIHEKKVSKRFKDNLEDLVSLTTGKIKVKGLNKIQKIMIREWLKDFSRSHKLPASFIKTFSETTSQASQIWSIAKKENNFKLFAPFLKKIVELTREKAQILGYEEHPYDAMIQTYEPCMTAAKLSTIFDQLQKNLKSLLQKIQNSKKAEDQFLYKKVDDEKQMILTRKLLSILPMDQSFSRIDISSHPFSSAFHPHDSRITTRFLQKSFMSNIFSILHEAGHSMYEMGLSLEHWGTPISEPSSLSVHESQSRFWENWIGRSIAFNKHFFPTIKKQLPTQLKNVSYEKFYKAINQVNPSLIRVEADEVTYCLHVILRFEIEKELISGKLDVNDLPHAWNQKMHDLLGITPKTDSEGVLQDIHWSLGDFGYFPTYALGNILAAQLFETFSKTHPNWDERVQLGELGFIKDWLKQNIHQWGRMYNLEEITKKATDKPFSITPYVNYLKKKYSSLYGF